jgi:hypothetical protein
MKQVGTDAVVYNKGLQIHPGEHPTYRAGTTKYTVKYNINAAGAKALANPGNGVGGFDQLYIPDFQNALQPVETIIMTNIMKNGGK